MSQLFQNLQLTYLRVEILEAFPLVSVRRQRMPVSIMFNTVLKVLDSSNETGKINED